VTTTPLAWIRAVAAIVASAKGILGVFRVIFPASSAMFSVTGIMFIFELFAEATLSFIASVPSIFPMVL